MRIKDELTRFGARAKRLWSTNESYGFRCDLAHLPDEPPIQSAVPLRMEAVDAATFDGFKKERTVVTGDDVHEVSQRMGMCAAGVEQLYIGFTPEREPAYSQWLVTPAVQSALHAFFPGMYPRLEPDTALIEGAYSFAKFRGEGAGYPGMYQVLAIARDQGYRYVITFVSADFRGIIRLLVRQTFCIDQIRLDQRRLWKHGSTFQASDEAAEARVEAALQKR